MKKTSICILAALVWTLPKINAQTKAWQQHVQYTIKVELNDVLNQIKGLQTVKYKNNSPDTLRKLFLHQYWNAFNDYYQTYNYAYGYQRVSWLKVNGVDQKLVRHKTILEVLLSKPLLPNSSIQIDCAFEGQLPGGGSRANHDEPNTGVRFSIAQWYPKICVYDQKGWHPDPFLRHEFYGEWGDYDIQVDVPKDYIVAGSGALTNENGALTGTRQLRRWVFIAKRVHDFVWSADPFFIRKKTVTKRGQVIEVVYKRDTIRLKTYFNNMLPPKQLYDSLWRVYLRSYDEQWKNAADAVAKVFPYIEDRFGPYEYEKFTIIQGGGGGLGMEYPTATLVLSSDLEVVFHELMHQWFQFMVANNENAYPWLDEGFTSYATSIVMNYYKTQFLHEKTSGRIHDAALTKYCEFALSGEEESMNTPANFYKSFVAYATSSYSKGEVLLQQLGYLVGTDVLEGILKEYVAKWKFKHPTPDDFFHVAELVSDMKLDWFQHYFVNTTHTIDYGIDSVWKIGDTIAVSLKKYGKIPMPIKIRITHKDKTERTFYIPMSLTYGVRKDILNDKAVQVLDEWEFNKDSYVIYIRDENSGLDKVQIDPSHEMADVNEKNNYWQSKW